MMLRRRKLRHALTILCAMCLAGAATWASQRWIERRDVPLRLEERFGSVSLHGLLNLPVVAPGLEPKLLEERPLYAAFCQRVAQRARTYMPDPDVQYDVSMAGLMRCRGFPFITQDWKARVDIYGNGTHDRFFAGQDGNLPPILYGGFIGNWLFYLAVSAGLLYAAEKAVIAIIIRRQRRRRRHGFPVVLINEEGT